MRAQTMMSTGIVAFLVCTSKILAQTSGSRTFSWNPKEHRIASTNQALALKLEGVPEAAPWFVAAQEGPTPVLVACRVQRSSPARNVPVSVISAIDDVVDVAVAPGEVTIRPGETPGALAVHLVVLPGTELTVFRNGSLVTRVKPGPSAMIENGRIIPVPVNGRQSVIMRTLTAGSIEAPPITVMPNGKRVVNLNALKSHLISWADPDMTPISGNTTIRHATLEIDIDESGRVSDVRARPGSEQVLAVYAASIRNWRFSPFRLGDKPTPVTAFLPFFTSNDGVFRHPLHPSVALSPTAAGGAACCQR